MDAGSFQSQAGTSGKAVLHCGLEAQLHARTRLPGPEALPRVPGQPVDMASLAGARAPIFVCNLNLITIFYPALIA